VATSAADTERAGTIAGANRGFVWSTAGVHPHDAAQWDDARDPAMIRDAVAVGAVAIGECGLDYHYDNSPRDVQRRVFTAQVALAAELGKPLVVHTRDAEADMIDCIRDAARHGVRGVLHCFSGGPALAEAGLSAGWFVSFAGVVTFRKWDADDLIRDVPADRILAESDSPYLTPVPFRGQRNEPARVAQTVERLAAARGMTPSALGEVIVENTRRCFGLVEPR
jgi:TatD DNase family protein